MNQGKDKTLANYELPAETGSGRTPGIDQEIAVEADTIRHATGFYATPGSSGLECQDLKAKTHKLLFIIVLTILFGVFTAVPHFGFFSENGAKSIKSIAVMPFVNESGNEDIKYLSDGMTETLIRDLSGITGLSVKARNFVFRYKGKGVVPRIVGGELNVEVVLYGRVLQRGENLTLNLELVETKTENVLWAEKYDRMMNDLVVLQSVIARKVSEKLKLKLSGEVEKKLTKTYTANAKAYQAYLKGRFHWRKRGREIRKGIEFFRQAIELDPNYALAWNGLAESLIYTGPRTEAKAVAKRALALDPDLAEARTVLAKAMQLVDWDFAGAESEFRVAVRSNPKYATARRWYGWHLSYLGRHDEAIKQARMAVDLEPLFWGNSIGIVGVLNNARKLDEATGQMQRTLEMFPTDASSHYFLAFLFADQGKFTVAMSECNRAIELGKQIYRLCPAYVYARSGKKEEAYKILAGDTQRVGFVEYDKEVIYAILDDKDHAFRHLENLIQKRIKYALRLKTEPAFDNLRDDPRYKDMIKRIGFPQDLKQVRPMTLYINLSGLLFED